MKLSFASLFAILLISTFLLVGCGDSETVSKPDTTPPLAPVVLALACSSSGDDSSENGPVEGGDAASVVPPGKADDYLSPSSREYLLWGEGQLELDAEWADKTGAEKLAHAEEMLGFKYRSPWSSPGTARAGFSCPPPFA